MPPGPDGDDEELVEIDVEIADADTPQGPPPLPAGPRSEAARQDVPALIDAGESTQPNPSDAPPAEPPPPPPDLLEITDAVELQPPLVEASEDDPAAAAALYEAEAEAAAGDGGRRAALLLEAARLREEGGAAPGEGGLDALETARAAFTADPASARARWVMRRMLSRAGRWDELTEVSEQAIAAQSAAADPRARADLLIERGRLLEDRLGLGGEAIEAYRAALAATPEHPGALLALLVAGAQHQQAALRAEALGGLGRNAQGTRRGALAIEEALAWREAHVPEGDDRALVALEAELGRQDPASPQATLLGELDALTRGDVSPAIAVRALEELARRAAATDPGLGVALARERARLLRQSLEAPEAALEVLDEAARLDPTHPLLAAERIEIALALDRREAAGDVARAFVADAARDDEAVDLALATAEAIFDPANPDPAIEILQTPRIRARRGVRSDLRAAELAIAVRRGDPRALAEAFAAEADGETAGDGASKSAALIAAAAIHAGPLGETEAGADLYRAAIAAADTAARSRPAVQALVALLAAGGRTEDAAATLESTLATPGANEGPAGEAFEIWAREVLVSFYADQLGAPSTALAHQRRLVELRPQELGRRVRLADLDLESVADRLTLGERADNFRALAAAAGDASARIALEVDAGRTLAESATADEVARGVGLLREVAAEDSTGLAAATLERLTGSTPARADAVGAELAAVEESDPSVERTRALRFRLAHHRARAGAFAEAIAALTPLRSEGDPLARAWSYELARRAGDPFLEVAVLSEETRAPDGALGDEAGVLLAHGEALARAGDPQGAAESLRRAVARAPDGETAADAALGLYRLAIADPVGGAAALPETLDALRDALGDDPALAAAVGREAALCAAAVGAAVARDARLDDGTAPHDLALLRFMTGARAGDPGAVAQSMVEIARGLHGPDGAPAPDAVPLLGRAAARARLGGAEPAEATARAVWAAARAPRAGARAGRPPGGGRGALADGTTGPAARAGAAHRRGARRGAAPRGGGRRRTGGGAGGGAAGLRQRHRARAGAARGLDRRAAGGARGGRSPRRGARAGAARRARSRIPRARRRCARRRARPTSRPDGSTTPSPSTPARSSSMRTMRRRTPEPTRCSPRTWRRPGGPRPSTGCSPIGWPPGRSAPRARIALLFERAEHRLGRLGDRTAAFEDFKRILKIDPRARRLLAQIGGGGAGRSGRARGHHLARAVPGGRRERRRGRGWPPPGSIWRLATRPAASRSRAIETLRRAAQDRPTDPIPLERMADLQLGRRDTRGAVEALRAAAERLADPRARAALALRVGTILRDRRAMPRGPRRRSGRRRSSIRSAPGAATLVALHDAAGDARGALEVIEPRGRPTCGARWRRSRSMRAGSSGSGTGWRTRAAAGARPCCPRRRRPSRACGGSSVGAPRRCRRPRPSRPRRAGVPHGDRRPGRGRLRRRGLAPSRRGGGGAVPAAQAAARPAPLGPAEAGRLGVDRRRRGGAGDPAPRARSWRASPTRRSRRPWRSRTRRVILRADALASPALRFHVGRALGAIAARGAVLRGRAPPSWRRCSPPPPSSPGRPSRRAADRRRRLCSAT